MFRWLTVTLVALLLPLSARAQVPPPPDGAKCFEIADWRDKKPIKKVPAFRATHLVAGPSGTVPVEVRQVWSRCKVGKTDSHYLGTGMRDASGRVIVPYRYHHVLPTSPAGALVARDGAWSAYTDGKGERPLGLHPERINSLDDYGQCGATRSGGARSVYMVTYDKTRSELDLRIFHGSEDPIIIRGGGVPRRVHRLMFAPIRNKDGSYGAQVLDAFGRPVSGVLGTITYWHAAKPSSGGTCEIGFPDMLSQGPSLDRDPAARHVGWLYFPLALDGSFYPMPEGAVGIFPLRGVPGIAGAPGTLDFTYANDNELEHFNDLWGLVYPDAQGWSFSIHRGAPLAAISGATGNEPRYRDPVRGPNGMFAAQDVGDGRWKVFSAGALQPMDLNGSFADGRSAIAGAQAQIAAQQAAIAERERLRRQAELARQIESTRAVFAEARAKGRLCQYGPPLNLTIDEIAAFARSCPGQFRSDDLERAKAAGLSAETEALIRKAWSDRAAAEYRLAQEREESLRNPVPRPYVPGAWSSAIHAAGDRIVADINRSSQNWFDQRKRDYQAQWQRNQRAY